MADSHKEEGLGVFRRDSALFVEIESLLCEKLDNSSITSALEVTQTTLFMHGFGIIPTEGGVGVIINTMVENHEQLSKVVFSYIQALLPPIGYITTLADRFTLLNFMFEVGKNPHHPASLATLCNSASFEISKLLVAEDAGMTISEHSKSINDYMAEILKRAEDSHTEEL